MKKPKKGGKWQKFGQRRPTNTNKSKPGKDGYFDTPCKACTRNGKPNSYHRQPYVKGDCPYQSTYLGKALKSGVSSTRSNIRPVTESAPVPEPVSNKEAGYDYGES